MRVPRDSYTWRRGISVRRLSAGRRTYTRTRQRASADLVNPERHMVSPDDDRAWNKILDYERGVMTLLVVLSLAALAVIIWLAYAVL